MDTIVHLQAELRQLRDARYLGASVVRHADGREVRYKTDAEMANAIADIERRIINQTSGQIKTVRLSSSKGF